MKVSGNCTSDCDLLELFLLGKKFTLFRRNLTCRIDRLGCQKTIFTCSGKFGLYLASSKSITLQP
jgi:hypothetical protein